MFGFPHLLIVVLFLLLDDLGEVMNPLPLARLVLGIQPIRPLHCEKNEDVGPHAFTVCLEHEIICNHLNYVSEVDQLGVFLIFLICADS